MYLFFALLSKLILGTTSKMDRIHAIVNEYPLEVDSMFLAVEAMSRLRISRENKTMSEKMVTAAAAQEATALFQEAHTCGYKRSRSEMTMDLSPPVRMSQLRKMSIYPFQAFIDTLDNHNLKRLYKTKRSETHIRLHHWQYRLVKISIQTCYNKV